MSNTFMTPASISMGKEPALPVRPALPEPPFMAGRPRGWVTIGAVGLCAALPPAAPVILVGVVAWHLWRASRHEQRLLAELASLCQRAEHRLGSSHVLSRSLRRYQRVVLRVASDDPRPGTLRASWRRRALAERLAHRCDHLLDEYGLLLVVGGPAVLMPEAPRPTDPTAPAFRPTLAERSRLRRGLRLNRF